MVGLKFIKVFHYSYPLFCVCYLCKTLPTYWSYSTYLLLIDHILQGSHAFSHHWFYWYYEAFSRIIKSYTVVSIKQLIKMLGRLLAMLLRNPFNSLGKNQQLIESLSETRLIRRAAQITVGIFNSIKVIHILLSVCNQYTSTVTVMPSIMISRMTLSRCIKTSLFENKCVSALLCDVHSK